MLTIDWSADKGWEAPKIEPFANFSVHPSAKVSSPLIYDIISTLVHVN